MVCWFRGEWGLLGSRLSYSNHVMFQTQSLRTFCFLSLRFWRWSTWWQALHKFCYSLSVPMYFTKNVPKPGQWEDSMVLILGWSHFSGRSLTVASIQNKSLYPIIKPNSHQKLNSFRSWEVVIDSCRVCCKFLPSCEVHQKRYGTLVFGDYHQFSVRITVKIGRGALHFGGKHRFF